MPMAEEKTKDNKYEASSIQVLEGLEAVRKRPAMYIGDLGLRGLHHLVYEVVDNSIDEAMAGHCDRIGVTIKKDGSIIVSDNGRGIPVDLHPTEGKLALEVVMTILHAGGKFDKDSYKVSGGLHGVGVSVVNALSSRLEATVQRDGFRYRQVYEKGDPVTEVEKVGKLEKDERSGTTIHFVPDDSIFDTTEFRFETLAERMRELAYLNQGVEVTICDERYQTPIREEYLFEGGLSQFVEYLDEAREPLHEQTISVEGESDGTIIELAMRYNKVTQRTFSALSTTSIHTRAAPTFQGSGAH